MNLLEVPATTHLIEGGAHERNADPVRLSRRRWWTADSPLSAGAGSTPFRAIEYEKVIAAPGHPIPFLRKGSRDELRQATGDAKLPALKLPDGTVIQHSRAILTWISAH